TFSEAVDAKAIEVQVLDVKRQRVDKGDAAVVPGTSDTVSISLAEGLGQGVYTIRWKMVSAVDGHITKNLIPFTVGDPGAVPDAAATTPGFEAGSSSGGVAGVVARWLTLLSSLVLTGLFLFVPLMLAPALRLLNRFDEGEAAVSTEARADVA